MVKAINLEDIVDNLPLSRESAIQIGTKYYKSEHVCALGHLPVRIVSNDECFLCKREKNRVRAANRRRKLGIKKQKSAQPIPSGSVYKELRATGNFERRVGKNGKKGSRTHLYHEVICSCGASFFIKDGMWGVTERCRTCATRYTAERNKKHDLTGSLKFELFHAAKRRARRKKIEFTISIEDIRIPNLCPILGIKLVDTVGTTPDRKPRYNAPSLDRLDPNLGYTKDNILVMSYKANTLKNNGTAEEHLKIADFMDNWDKDYAG